MVLANINELINVLNDQDDLYDITWYTATFNDNIGQEIDRTLQKYIPPVRIHDEWTRETMSTVDKLLVKSIINYLPTKNRLFWQYSYGDLPYREATSLNDYLTGISTKDELFDAVVESIKLIKTDYRAYARHSGIPITDIAMILYDIQLALKKANDEGEFDYVDPIEDYDYNYTSVIGPSH